MSCGVGRRRGSGPALLSLWCRLAAVALIQLLAREPPYTSGVAPKDRKKTKKKKKREREVSIKLRGEAEDLVGQFLLSDGFLLLGQMTCLFGG